MLAGLSVHRAAVHHAQRGVGPHSLLQHGVLARVRKVSSISLALPRHFFASLSHLSLLSRRLSGFVFLSLSL